MQARTPFAWCFLGALPESCSFPDRRDPLIVVQIDDAGQISGESSLAISIFDTTFGKGDQFLKI